MALSSYLISTLQSSGRVSGKRVPEMDPADEPEQKLKVVICGETKTGKTKLFDRISKDRYTEMYLQTIGSDYTTCSRLVPGANVTIDLWDTAGAPEYRIVLPIFFRDADIVLIVYDVTNLESFKNIQFYLQNVAVWAGDSDIDIAIVGSKIDSWTKERVVTFDMAHDVCQSFNCKSFEVSAVTTQGIEDMLQKMLRRTLKRKRLLPLWLMGSKATEDDYAVQMAQEGMESALAPINE